MREVKSSSLQMETQRAPGPSERGFIAMGKAKLGVPYKVTQPRANTNVLEMSGWLVNPAKH